MIHATHAFLLALGSSLAASIVAKATIVTALGLMCARLARHNRAAARHVVLAATFAVLILLPVISIVAPPVRVAVPVVGRSDTVFRPPAGAINPIPFLAAPQTHSRVTPAVSRSSTFSLSRLLITAWLAGVSLCLIPMVVGLWKIRLVRRSGVRWAHGQAVVAGLALETGIRGRVALLLHEALPGPTTSGILRPAILMPPDAQTWNPEDLNRALVHELEHVRRGDYLSNCLARAACAAYWFHPLVWMAWRQLALESERSCDDAVLGRSRESTAYAEQLVGLARRLSMASKSPHPAMANRSDLAIRIRAVLDSRQRRGRAGRFLVALGCAATAALVFTMSPLRTVSTAGPGYGLLAIPAGAPLQAFKAVSIRRSHGEDSHKGVSPNGLEIRNLPPEVLIGIAYGYDLGDFGFRELRSDEMVGGPSWAHVWLSAEGMNYEGYDVDAKVDESFAKRFGEDKKGHLFWSGKCPYRRDILLMFQLLLAERFKLKVTHEIREVPIYALLVAPNGPKMLHAMPTQPPPPCPADMYCVQGYASTLRLAAKVRPIMDRPVIDRTGLKGGYYINLQWPRNPSVAGTHIAPSVASTAFMFTALEQQLGLKLEPTQGPVDFLVIDHIERPSENQ